MFSALRFHSKISPKRLSLNFVLIVIYTILLWSSEASVYVKIIFNIFLVALSAFMILQERRVLQIHWKLLEEIHVHSDKSKNPYKLSSCILTSWYCVLGLTANDGSYKKLHIWFDQLDKQNAWQLRRNIQAWKEKSP